MTTLTGSAELTDEPPDRYSNWLRHMQMSLFGIPVPGLVVAGATIIWALLMMMAQRYGVMGVSVGLAVVVIVTCCIPIDSGRVLLVRVLDAVQDRGRRLTGETLYVSGALSTLPAEVVERLPGALIDVETLSATDGLGDRYTLLHHRQVGQLAVVLGCEPDGTALQQQSAVNDTVGVFGSWISGLSVEDGLSGASVVVDSAAVSSDAMVERIREAATPGAPAFAQDVLDASLGLQPAMTAAVNVYSTLVYDRSELGGDRKDLSPAVAEIAARLPGQKLALAAGGGGHVKALTDTDLGRVAQIAYQPARASEIELDELTGMSSPHRFTEAGPDWLDDSNGRLVHHDGVVSMSVMMTVPPRSHITVASLNGLFGPNAKFLRKRVAILYRPVDPGEATALVRRQVRNTKWKQQTTNNPSMQDAKDEDVAARTELELAQGCRLSMFGVMMTVTFQPSERALREATAQVKSIMNGCNMGWRWVEHAGSAAMHTTMPFGILPWKYTMRPVWMEG